MLCCLRDQSRWQIDLPVCLPTQAWSRRSYSQAWFCVKIEYDVVWSLKPKLYKCYVNDIYHKQNQPDKLLKQLNNYHPNIKLTIEVNPRKFLYTEIMVKSGITETSVIVKESRIHNHWSSAVPKMYKRNAILGDLHTAVILNLKKSILGKRS